MISSIPGFDCITIKLTFSFADGYDEDGNYYIGTDFDQLLPLSEEGLKMMRLFEEAFNKRVLFRIEEISGSRYIVPNSITFKSGGNEYENDTDYFDKLTKEFQNIGIV